MTTTKSDETAATHEAELARIRQLLEAEQQHRMLLEKSLDEIKMLLASHMFWGRRLEYWPEWGDFPEYPPEQDLSPEYPHVWSWPWFPKKRKD